MVAEGGGSGSDWSTSGLSLAAAIGLLVFGLSGPLSGRLMARYGIRAVTLAALLLTTASLAASALATELWQIALFFGLLSGLGTGLVASVLGPTDRQPLVPRAPRSRHRPAPARAPPPASCCSSRSSPDSRWSRAGGSRCSLMAVIAAVLVVPVLLWFREDPADLGLRPLGRRPGPSAAARPAADPGVMRGAVRTVDFWFLASTFFVCGATSNGLVGQHFISHAVDHGFSTVAASGALALMGAFNFIGTIASGWLTDRYDPRKLLLIYYGFRGVSLLFLPLIHDSVSIAAFAVLFGLDYIATVPPTVMLVANRVRPAQRGRRLRLGVRGAPGGRGRRGLGGRASSASTVGDYAAAFYAAGAIAIVAGFAALMIGRMGRRGEAGDMAGAAA